MHFEHYKVTEDFQKDFLKTFNKPMDRPANTAPINLTPLEYTSSLKKQKPPEPVLTSAGDTKNPFLSSLSTTITGAQSTNQDASNPFLSPTLTNSFEQDLSNPFIGDTTQPTVVKEKRRAPVKIMTKTQVEPKSPDVNTSTKVPEFSDTGKELLYWCQKIVKTYKQTAYMPANKTFEQLEITNFTTSWRSGLAFCAIFYHFKPSLM